MKATKLKFIVGTVVILLVVFVLAISGMEETKAYYQTVPELKAMGAKAEGRLVRVAGNVVVGSIERLEQSVVKFEIDYEGESLLVRYIGRGPLPDTLIDHAQAVAEGKLLHDGTFEATLVQAKCASKYETAYEQS